MVCRLEKPAPRRPSDACLQRTECVTAKLPLISCERRRLTAIKQKTSAFVRDARALDRDKRMFTA